MGKNKSCDESTRQLIVKLHLDRKWTYRRIAKHLECSVKKVFNAIAHYKTNGTTKSVVRKSRPRKTSPREDLQIIRVAKQDPFKGSNEIRNEVFSPDDPRNISSKLVRRRLVEAKLFGRVSRKVPLLTKQHREKRLLFAKKYLNWTVREWKKVLFSDETKINMVNSDGKRYVRRPINHAFDYKYTRSIVKHGGGNIKVWGCFSGCGVGPVRKIEGIMDQFQYKNILEETMIPYTDDHLPVTWIFQHDNDPKHTARSVKSFLSEQRVTMLDWPANSPDLNPIENLWYVVKKKVSVKRNSSQNELYKAFVEAWNSIPLDKCMKLLESMPRRCRAVINNKGYATKY